MSIDLWISVALAIPLSILANIVTPKFQRWLEARLARDREFMQAHREKNRAKRLAALRKEYEEVTSLNETPSRLTHHYMDALIWIAFYGAFGAIYGAIFNMFGEFTGWQNFSGTIARLGSQIIALATAMLIFQKAAAAIRVARRCRNFDSYRQTVESQIAKLSGGST